MTPETAVCTLPDGVRLVADVYRPPGDASAPVLLMRQPYGRAIASTLVYAHPAWYAAQGYIVAIQDVRGSGDSGGDFRLFADDSADGAASVAWAAALPGSSGRVGMYGFSYQGTNQLLALAGGAPALGALCPAMIGWDMFSDWAYEGGAFRLAGNLGWGAQMAALQARRAGDAPAYAALHAGVVPAERPALLETYRSYGHYTGWLEHPAPGPFWEAMAPRAALAGGQVDVPMLHIGGWYDTMLEGTLAAYAAMAARSAAMQRLVVGPWTHQPWGRRVGAVDFGPDAVGRIDRMQVAWFDRHLKGVANDVDDWPAAQCFDLLAKRWRGFAAWSPGAERRLYLAGDGLAASAHDSRLLPEPPATETVDRLVHDPWRPVPSLGGHNAQPGGMQDRAAVDDRFDVLTYTSAPLDAPLLLAGNVTAELCVSANAPSFDVSAVLSVVTPEGRVFNLTQGHLRADAPAPRLSVPMRATCATVPAGHALRLSVAGADYPALAVNAGTGAAAGEAEAMSRRVITLALRSGGPEASCLVLPAGLSA